MSTRIARTIVAGTAGVVAWCVCFSATADINVWSGNGPDGATVPHLIFDTTRPGVAYSATSRGVFKSLDSGKQWQSASEGLNESAVSRIAVSASGDLLAVGQRLSISIDGAASWRQIDELARIREAVWHPTDVGSALVIDLSGATFVTTDGGVSWTQRASLPPNIVNEVAVDPATPGRVYAVGRAGVFRSEDFGASWEDIRDGLPQVDGELVVVSPTVPSTVHVLMRNEGAFRSVDAGLTWEAHGSLPNDSFRDLVVDPADPNRLYVATGNNRVYLSQDSGVSWQPTGSVGLIGNTVETVAVDPREPTRLLIGQRGPGVLASDDAGASFSVANTGLQAALLQSLTVEAGGTMLTSYPGGVYRSDDRGTTWRRLPSAPPQSFLNAVRLSPADPNVIFVAGQSDVYRSDDAGGQFALVVADNLPSDSFRDLLLAPSDRSVFYLYGLNRGITRSTDGGATWAAADIGLVDGEVSFDVGGVAVAPDDADRLLAIVRRSNLVTDGVYASNDGGMSWALTPLPEDDRAFSIAISKPDPLRAFASLESGLYRTDNNGAQWQRVTGQDYASSRVLVTDPQFRDVVYVTRRQQVARSVDGGESFREVGRLPSPTAPTTGSFEHLVIDPDDNRLLHVAYNTVGVLSYELGVDLQLEAGAVPAQTLAGTLVDQELLVTNLGPDDAAMVQFTHELQASDWEIVGISAAGCPVEQPTSISCELGPLKVGAAMPVNITLRVGSAQLNSESRVVAFEAETDGDNNVVTQNLAPPALYLDIDQDGETRALSDGVMLLRRLFGFAGNTLTQGAANEAGQCASPTCIENYLDASLASFDVDGDGEVQPLTDGLLVLRYLFEFRGDALVSGATGAPASEIETRLARLAPR